MRKSGFSFSLFLLLSSLSFCAQIARIANCSKTQDVYPGDSIQEAIDSAQPGDTIIVHVGIYRERLVVNKKVSLVGEDKHNTIIDWNGIGSVFHVTADNTVIANFTVTLASRPSAYPDSGIHLDHSSGNNIVNNIMIANYRGLYLDESSDNTITGNDIKNNDYGICLYDSSSNNIISGNSIANNEKGIYLRRSSDNIIHHNSFINNTKQVDDFYLERRPSRLSKNVWDDDYPSGGNYWSDYAGEDANSDGIGDNAYFIYQENQDRYPLVPDLVPPSISIATPENKTYVVATIPMTFTVNEATSWIGYSLDRQANNTIAGNITLAGLSDGPHSLAMYARDILGNIGSSGTVYFTVDTKAPSISLVSPTNTAYPSNSIPLRFVVEEAASWVSYSLDGQKNVTVSGNTTLVALSE